MNLEGFKTRKNKPFGKNSVYDIISNEKYTGTYIYNKGDKHNHHFSNNKEIRIEEGIPAIISSELYQQAMSKRHTNKRVNFKKNSNVYILSSLIYCGKCGGKYTGSTSIHKRGDKEYRNGFYVCTNRNKLTKCDNHRIKQELIENNVINSLINKILNGQSVEEVVNRVKIEYQKLRNENFNEKTVLENQLKKIQKELDNLVDLIAQTGNDRLVKKLELLEAQEDDIKSKLDFINKTTLNISDEKIKEIFTADINLLANGSKEQIKKIISKYIKRITIFDEHFIIDYSFDNVSKECSFSQIQDEPNLRYQILQKTS